MNYSKYLKNYIISSGGKYIGTCWCRGYDSYGLLSKIGGIAKNHPNDKDMIKIKNQIMKWML